MLATIGIQPSEVSRIVNLANDIISQSTKKSTKNSKKVENGRDFSLSGEVDGDIAPRGS